MHDIVHLLTDTVMIPVHQEDYIFSQQDEDQTHFLQKKLKRIHLVKLCPLESSNV